MNFLCNLVLDDLALYTFESIYVYKCRTLFSHITDREVELRFYVVLCMYMYLLIGWDSTMRALDLDHSYQYATCSKPPIQSPLISY